MNVLFVTAGDERLASSRYRAFQFFDYLEHHGISCSLMRREGGFMPCRAASADVVFVQKKLLSAVDLALLRMSNSRIVYDFDDAVYMAPADQFGDSPAARAKGLRRLRRFARMCRAASVVIAGNEFLKANAQQYAHRAVAIPTCVDTDAYRVVEKPQDPATLVIGWIGQSSNLHYLGIVRPALERVGRAYRNVQVRIVCSEFVDLAGIGVDKKVWKLEEEISDVRSFDIGIMPLTDGIWTQGKCGFKALQYMAVGIPVVASPVGVNVELVRDGVTGFTARTEDEWFHKLSRLIEDASLRQRMGREGRKLVEERYSLRVTAPRVKAVLESLLG